jgi:hypothetical protein
MGDNACEHTRVHNIIPTEEGTRPEQPVGYTSEIIDGLRHIF